GSERVRSLRRTARGCASMSVISEFRSRPSRSRPILGPDDLRLAADVFEQALQRVDESVSGIAPHATRQLLARYIIEKALGGERDPDRLRDGALARLNRAAAK